MNKKNIMLFLLFLIVVVQIVFGITFFVRTKISNYDVNLAHERMDTKYCPYCGQPLEE